MIKKIKTFLIDWLFKEYKQELSKELQDNISSLGKAITIEASLREQLKGYDYRSIDVDVAIEEMVEDDDDLLNFLKDVHDLSENEALRKIRKYIIAEQIDSSIKYAEDMAQVNFGRATINGLALEEKEIERLNALYLEKVDTEEDFDKHEIV